MPKPASPPPARHESPSATVPNQTDSPLLAAELPELGEDDIEDDDSTLISDPSSSTASVASSILEYRKYKGRSYHSARHESEYFVPTDEQALENFDIMHHFLTLLLNGKLYLAPIKDDIAKVLDVGTGTGVWAIDYADEHPNAAVIGTDLSPVQPSWVPPNLKFEIDDCTKAWTWDENTFDFVHMRYLVGAIKDWNALFKDAFRSLKPGAWVESCETEPTTLSDDGTVTDDGSTALGGTWGRMFIEGGKVTGCSWAVIADDLQMKAIKDAGFVNIQEATYKASIQIPFGSWPKDQKMAEIGQYAKLSLESDLAGYSQFVWHEILKWPAEDYQMFLMRVRKDLRNRHLHPYFRVRYVWGQKPEQAVTS
ncbi:hypothetical protein FZEAL_2531 [Fusarium zealandicum]|uniref:TAM domain methyltransferase n=1 Tax=Fusarium zealandicum TaxID=1053134 RepID=A0A8H4URA7_9HYPO|nr:hypothetical protein FZEAL_2531 [Fusarium zealandicum]